MTLPNPLTDELSDEAKHELAAIFAALAIEYPPVRFDRIGKHTAMLPLDRCRPWRQARQVI